MSLSDITVTVEPSEELLSEIRCITREEHEKAMRDASSFRVDENLR